MTENVTIDDNQPDIRSSNGSSAPPREYFSSLEPKSHTLPHDFVSAVKKLEEALELPVWMLIQSGDDGDLGNLSHQVLEKFLNAREDLAKCGHIALLIDSPGGSGDVAYKIARILQRDKGFTVVIPRYAKSAATLLSLGAERAIMGDDAEIGPLDAQLWDFEREETGSALNEVQALDQLHTVALEHLDATMFMMTGGSKKRSDVLLPIATKFVSDMMRSMLEKIDAVHYAKQSRVLAVATHYAIRLLRHREVSLQNANIIAQRLVHTYPEHGFVIDRDEARDFLPLIDQDSNIKKIMLNLDQVLRRGLTAFGTLKEVHDES